MNTIEMLRFSIRSHFRMWIRGNREWVDSGKGQPPKYRRELCGFGPRSERWIKATGKASFGKGLKEIFSNP